MAKKRVCICGKVCPDGLHPLGSTACPVHGEKPAANARAWAIGTMRRGRFHIRRIVWGRLMARSERDLGEQIRRAVLYVKPE